MDFISLVKKEKKRYSFKWIQVAAAALVLFILALFSTFWSTEPDVSAHDFLPANTTFYYQWANKNAFNQDLDKYELFDQSIAQEHLNEVAGMMGPNFSKVEELIWFRTEVGMGDAYLLRFSGLSDKYLVELATSHPEVYFYKPINNILFIGPDEATAQDVSSFVLSRWALNYSNEGVNIYWQIDKAPEFLQSLSGLILPLASTRDTFINFGDRSIDLWQPKHASSSQNMSAGLANGTKVPNNFDLALGFNASSTEGFDKFIASNIILPHFDSLPYHNLSNQELKQYLLNGSLLFAEKDAWLLVSNVDWQSRALELAQNLGLVEVKKVLVDGTLYTELVAGEEQVMFEHQFNGQNYWQIDNLYGIGLGGAYYMSNQAWMIEKLIVSDSSMIDLWSGCGQDDKKINDFVRWQTSQLVEGELKGYLVDRNIQSINLFSYQNYLVEGIKLCF